MNFTDDSTFAQILVSELYNIIMITIGLTAYAIVKTKGQKWESKK